MTDEIIEHPKRKRGRPRKNPDIISPDPKTSEEPVVKAEGKHPASENLLNTYPFKKLVYYPDNHPHLGVGLFYNPEKYPQVSIASFKVKKDGSLRWCYSVIPNKYGGKPILQHDMIKVPPSAIRDLGDACHEFAAEYLGDQQVLSDARWDYLEKKKEKKELDNIGAKIIKYGL